MLWKLNNEHFFLQIATKAFRDCFMSAYNDGQVGFRTQPSMNNVVASSYNSSHGYPQPQYHYVHPASIEFKPNYMSAVPQINDRISTTSVVPQAIDSNLVLADRPYAGQERQPTYYYPYNAFPTVTNKSLADMASKNRFVGRDDREYSAHVTNVRGVVPTGLFTSYVPASEFKGVAVHSNQEIPRETLSKIHESRVQEHLGEASTGASEHECSKDCSSKTESDRGRSLGQSKQQHRTPPMTTIYYTVDQYPPYYSNARKMRAVRKERGTCCQ